jgi:hypothetical protein
MQRNYEIVSGFVSHRISISEFFREASISRTPFRRICQLPALRASTIMSLQKQKIAENSEKKGKYNYENRIYRNGHHGQAHGNQPRQGRL